MVGSRRDREADLGRLVERAIQELRLASDMLHTTAENLPMLTRTARPHLLAVAERLDGAAAALGHELHAGLDAGGVTILARYGRKAVYGVGGILFMIVGGVAEGAGKHAYEAIVQQQTALDQLLTNVEQHATALESEPAEASTPDTDTTTDAAIVGNDEAGYFFVMDAAAEIIGLTPRQVDYWVRTDLVPMSVHEGGRAYFNETDLTKMAVVKYLLDDGIRLETIRGVMPKISAAVDDGATLYLDPQHGAYLDPNEIGSLNMPGITRSLDMNAIRRELADGIQHHLNELLRDLAEGQERSATASDVDRSDLGPPSDR